MTTFPAFVLCCRCCAAVAVEATEEGKRWSRLTRHGHAPLDICPDCARGVRAFLHTVPDALEHAMAKKKISSIKAAAQSPKRKAGRPPGAKNKPKARPSDSPWLTIDQFCERFHISRSTYTQRHRQHLPVAEVFGRRLIPLDAAERYVASFMRKGDEPRAGA